MFPVQWSVKHIIGLILSLAWPVFSQATSTNHYDTVKQSRWFAISGGFANAATSEAHALTAICGQTNAVATLQRLLQEKEPAPQLYGLLGLQVLVSLSASNDVPHSQELEKAAGEASIALSRALPLLLSSEKNVRVLDGCIAGERQVAEVARQIRGNQWRLRSMPLPDGKYAPRTD